MIFLGIDIGSLSCDAVLIDENKNILSSSVIPTGVKNIESIAKVKKMCLMLPESWKRISCQLFPRDMAETVSRKEIVL